MPTVNELYNYLESAYPAELSEEWDNDGLMCLTSDKEIKKAMVTLDITAASVDEAQKIGCDVIISHHPLIFNPLKSITDPKLIKLIKSDISAMSFHTRLDTAAGGVNDELCRVIGGTEPECIGMMRITEIELEKTTEDFLNHLRLVLGCRDMQCVKRRNTVRKVAVLGGGGKSFYHAALESGADTFLTGEVSHDTLITASEGSINLIAAGHFFTEEPVCRVLVQAVERFCPDIEIVHYNSYPCI